MKYFVTIILVLSAITGCSVNKNPPQYIKSASYEKIGDYGVKVKFSLADKNDKTTAYGGKVVFLFYNAYVDIYQRNYETVHQWKCIYMKTIEVRADNFKEENNELVYTSDKIPYEWFDEPPKRNTDGKLVVVFEKGSFRGRKETTPENW